MQITRKSIAILIIVVILLSLMPNNIQAITTKSLADLRKMYPTGYQWNDDYYGNTECHGFALLIYDGYYGINPLKYAEKVQDVEQVQPGDILRYNGHTVFVLTRNGENTTVVECNYDWNNHVRWDQYKTMSEFRNNFEYILKAPYILGTSPKTPETPKNVRVDISSGVTINWDRASDCYGYRVEVYNASNTKVSEQEIKKASETSAKVYSLATGTYTVRVYALGIYSNSVGYGSATFSCQAEAESYSISPENKVIAVGESFKYTVNLMPADGIAQIRFYAGDNTDTSIIKIEEDGTITGLKEGTTTVKFEFKTSRTKRTIGYEIKVVPPLKLRKNQMLLNLGDIGKIELASKSDEAEVKWSSSNKKIATVDEEGNITAVSAGTVKIWANQTVYNSKRNSYKLLMDSCMITIVDPSLGWISATINHSNYQLNNMNESLKLILTETSEEGDTRECIEKITWSSSNDKIATVNSNGVVMPKAGGFAYITAETQKYGTARCWVYVCMLRPLSDGSKVYPGDLNGDGVINLIDRKMILDLENKEILTEDEIAIGDLDSNGLIDSNDADIVENLYNSNINFIPGQYKPITNITLNKSQVTLQEGENIQLIATTTPSLEETTDSPIITWKSSDPYVARVDENGNVTYVSGGTATITAKTLNGLEATCKITANGEVIYGAKLNYNKCQLNSLNERLKLELVETLTPEEETKLSPSEITWESNNEGVAIVDSNGNVTPVNRRICIYHSNNRKIWKKDMLGICKSCKNIKRWKENISRRFKL